jgi:hypothetical protein
LGFVLTAPFTTVAAYMTYIGDARIGAVSKVTNVFVATAAGGALAGFFGLAGVALALALGEVIGFGAIYVRAAAQWTGLPPIRLLGNWLTYTVAGLVPTFAFGKLSTALLTGPALETLAVTGVLLIPIVCLSLALFGMSTSDRAATCLAIQRLPWRLAR